MTTYNKFLNKPDNNQIINSLQNENKFLKDELNDETKKLKQVIDVLHKEIEFYKNNTDDLTKKIKDLKKTQRNKLFYS